MCCALPNLIRLNLVWTVYRDGLERQRTTETSSRYSNCRIQCNLRVYILGSVAMSGLVIVHRLCKLKLYSTHGRGIPLNKTSSVSPGQNLSIALSVSRRRVKGLPSRLNYSELV